MATSTKFAAAYDVFQAVSDTTDSLQELVSGESHAVGGDRGTRGGGE